MRSPSPTDHRALLGIEARLAGTAAEDRSVDVVASTGAIDSYDSILEQDSWRLERYLANPVVLYGHQGRELPIGHASNVRIEDGALRARLHLVSAAANPLAEQVWQSIKQKSLRAVSVGFIPNTIRFEKRDGREVMVLADNELMEISVVPVPANPEALAQLRARAAAHHEEPMAADASKTAPIVETDADPILNAPATRAPAVAVGQPELSRDALALKCAAAEAEVARLHARLEGVEAQLVATRAELTELRAADTEDQLAKAHSEIARLEAQLEGQERRALLADGRAQGKLTPSHLDPATPHGAFVARLSVEQLREYLATKERVRAPDPPRAPRPVRARDWSELTPSQKAELYHNDRPTYDALKAAAGQ